MNTLLVVAMLAFANIGTDSILQGSPDFSGEPEAWVCARLCPPVRTCDPPRYCERDPDTHACQMECPEHCVDVPSNQCCEWKQVP